MIELISIHIPKTAGTSFHRVLERQYPEAVSPSLRRRDVLEHLTRFGDLAEGQPAGRRVLHGHFTYREVAGLHRRSGAKVICWLRHPAERVISNWRFFLDRLRHPDINPAVAVANAHRRDEGLLTYAAREENRDRMSKFLEGITLDGLFFTGIQEWFAEDVARLAGLLRWPEVEVPQLNIARQPDPVEAGLIEAIIALNRKDMALYEAALARRNAWLTQTPVP